MTEGFVRLTDFDLDQPLTVEIVAEAVGTRPALILRLARLGVIESVATETGEMLLPTRTIITLRRMQRLRRDLGVNFAGAAIILELVERLDHLTRAR